MTGLIRLLNPRSSDEFGMTPTTTLPPFPEEIEDWWWNQALHKWPDYSEDKLLNLIRAKSSSKATVSTKRARSTRIPMAQGFCPLSPTATSFFPVLGKQWLLPCRRLTFSETGKLPAKDRCASWIWGREAEQVAWPLFLLRKWGLTNPMALEAWDYSGKSLAMMKNLHRTCMGLWPDSKVFTTRKDLTNDLPPPKARKFDLILLGFPSTRSIRRRMEETGANGSSRCSITSNREGS